MATRYLSGDYPGGYTLSIGYRDLVVEASATIGGNGLDARYLATVQNDGVVDGAFLYAGGTLTNGSASDHQAMITGTSTGAGVGNALALINNFATITGAVANGVYLRGGGRLVNGSAGDVAALIYGGRDGIYSRGAAAGVVNYGTISAGVEGLSKPYYAGVEIYGGDVINGSTADSAALINGYNGVRTTGLSQVTNYGQIRGSRLDGVSLGGGGSVVNGSAGAPSARISGEVNGLVAGTGTHKNGKPTGSDQIINFGVITGGSGYGVVLAGHSGTLTNGSASDTRATTKGAGGVYATSYGPATITNWGTISGTEGTAIRLNNAADVLVVEAGAVFNGTVTGGGAKLELASGTGTITIAGGDITVSAGAANKTYLTFGALEVGRPAHFVLQGSNSIGANGIGDLDIEGGLTVLGSLAISGAVGGEGTLDLVGAVLTVEAGANFSVGQWSLTNAAVTIGETVSESGAFVGETSDLAVLAGDTFTLSGPAVFKTGATVSGSGVLALANAQVFDLTIAGGMTVRDTGFFTDRGTVAVGDAASGAQLMVDAGAYLNLHGAVRLISGSVAGSSLLIDGLMLKDLGRRTATVGLAVTDNGMIQAGAGTLDLSGTLGGTGAMEIDTGASLRVDQAAAASLTLSFSGSGGTLLLGSADQFAATIAGFSAGDRLDLVHTAATSASVDASDQLTVLNGATTVAVLQLSGDYSGKTFAVTSDNRKGSLITLGPAEVHAMTGAMAGLASSAGHARLSQDSATTLWPPALSLPRAG